MSNLIECISCKNQSIIEKWISFDVSFRDSFIKLKICPECNFVQGIFKEEEKDIIEIYICPHCQRDKFEITFDSLTGFTKGIVQIECKCGLKTTFDWNEVKQFDLGSCGRN